MKIPDIQLQSPILTHDPEGTQQIAFLVAKMQSIIQDIYDKLGAVRVVDSAPASGEISTIGDMLGNVFSEVMILNDATQSSRRLYYKDKAGNLRYIDSA